MILNGYIVQKIIVTAHIICHSFGHCRHKDSEVPSLI
jgi:hypothetical protein